MTLFSCVLQKNDSVIKMREFLDEYTHDCTVSGLAGLYVKSGILGFIGDGPFLAFVLILLQSSRLLGKQTKCTPQSHVLIVSV